LPNSRPARRLDPEIVSNAQLGAVIEELIRKFAEPSNETPDFSTLRYVT
jgi:hypothetical protein